MAQYADIGLASFQSIVSPRRIIVLNSRRIDQRRGRFVLYWMQQSQRAAHNHALEHAIELANHLKQPLQVVFGLTADYPEANLRHFTFMLQGLRETQAALAARHITMAVRLGDPAEVALNEARAASLIVCDRGYLRHQVAWRKRVAEATKVPVIRVESDVVVPVAVVSDKAEYAARTIRPKLKRHIETYGQPLPELSVKKAAPSGLPSGEDLDDIDTLLAKLKVDTSVAPVTRFFRGGTSEAVARFERFIEERLPHYNAHSNQPQTDDVSGLSPYLHFGQISPLYLAHRIGQVPTKRAGQANIDAYLEQLIVRRELAINFVSYRKDYDSYTVIPEWARQSLAKHASDKRDPCYTLAQLEKAKTHDDYWNAAMLEMVHTGFMHNYMRMYWGKKIIEWSPSPKEAFERTLYLNNKYFLDGRDPNSYASVAWLYGVHDRGWPERPIFGKVRYMAASGLERKCDIKAYVKKIETHINMA